MKIRVFLYGLYILSCIFSIRAYTIHNISIGAVFEASEYPHYSEIFYKAVRDNREFFNGVKIDGTAILALDNLYDSLRGICSVFARNNIVAFIVVGSKETINALTLISEPLGIPILGYVEHNSDMFEFSKILALVQHIGRRSTNENLGGLYASELIPRIQNKCVTDSVELLRILKFTNVASFYESKVRNILPLLRELGKYIETGAQPTK